MGRSAEQTLKSTVEEAELPNLVAEEPRELSFGRYLRRQRILRGISRSEVVRVTKVSLDYYEALENNEFDRLPPQPFVVGFLRVFARFAGLDPEDLVNRFLSERDLQGNTEEIDTIQNGYFRRNLKTFLALCGLACFLFLIFLPYFRARS